MSTITIPIDASAYVKKTELPSNLTLYPTNVPSSVVGYSLMVTDIEDPSYNTIAVNIPTGAITTTGQLIASLATTNGQLTGNPGQINVSTIGNVRRVSGSGTATFYYEIYLRTGAGVETLIGTSSNTLPVSLALYTEFQADALFNNGIWEATDKIVVKYYANRIAGGSNPSYEFQFGGALPVRTIVPVPAAILVNLPITVGSTSVNNGNNGKLLNVTAGKVGEVAIDTTPTDGSTNPIDSNAVFDGLATKQPTLVSATNIKTVNGNSLLGSGDLVISGGGGTPAGTTGQIQFNNAGSFGADSNLFWDNTNKRLGIGATPATTVRLDVRAQGALSTDIAFRVRNSADTLNHLESLGNGQFVLNYNLISSTTVPVRYYNNSIQNFALYSNGGVAIGIGASCVNFGTAEAGISIGTGANSLRGDNIAIGNGAVCQNGIGNDISIGKNAGVYNATAGTIGIQIGRSVYSNSNKGIMLGSSSAGNASGSICVGNYISYATSTTPNLSVFGSYHTVDNGITNTISIGDGVNSTTRAQPRSSNSFNIFLATQEQVFYVNNKTNLVLKNQAQIIAGTEFETAATNAMTIHNGVAPTANIANAFVQYSADITAGNAAPHFRTENGTIVKLYQNAAVTTPQGIADTLTNLGVLASSTIATSIPTHDGVTYDTNAIQTLTAVEYAAIGTPNASTLYFIV